MRCKRLFNYKLVLGLSNFVFSLCGIILLFGGFTLYTDSKRILLSRLVGASSEKLIHLPHPFFYYIAIGLAGAGLIAIFASSIGWWATCLNTYCLLSIYFIVVLSLLLFEFGICLLITLWPQCLGLNLDEMIMVKVLQGGYGVPGQEQLTAAIDLAQTKFKCCAINSNINYDTSLWRLQGYGQRDWAVPLTCCILTNRMEPQAYLDPKPENLTLCQSLQRHEYSKARYVDGCLDKISEWYREHYGIFLGASLLLAIIEFAVLLSIILSCTRMQKKKLPKVKKVVQRMTIGTSTQTIATGDRPVKRRQAPQVPVQQQQMKHQHQMQTQENIYMDSLISDHSGIGSSMNPLASGSVNDIHTQSPYILKNKYSSNSFVKMTPNTKYQSHLPKSYLV